MKSRQTAGCVAEAVFAAVVMMDEAMEEKPPITQERADALVGEALHLLMGSEEPGSFALRYARVREREAAAARGLRGLVGWAALCRH